MSKNFFQIFIAISFFFVSCQDSPIEPRVDMGTVSGKVINETGSPVEGAIITIKGQSNFVTTNAFGLYLISDLKQGTYILYISKDGFKSDSASVNVLGNANSELDFKIFAREGAISGLVLDSRGDPLSGVWIRTLQGTDTATSDTQGKFLMSNVKPGIYTLIAQKEGYFNDSISLSLINGQSVSINFELEPHLCLIRGSVLDYDGIPIAEALVSIEPSVSSTTSDNQGNYILTTVYPGIISFSVIANGYYQADTIVALLPGEEKYINFVMNPLPGQISGIVINENQTPLPNVRITTEPYTEDILTSESGKFTLKHLSEGDYNLVVTKEGFARFDTLLTVHRGDSLSLQILLRFSSINIEWVEVVGGEFEMGDSFNEGNANELPLHRVKLSNFRISRYEITFDQYDKYCEMTGKIPPPDNGYGRGQIPVMNISWLEAVEFCEWASRELNKNIMLPTEAQWEFAARERGSIIRYAGVSDSSQLQNYGWYKQNSQNRPHSVGLKTPNALGIYDMTGNVGELVKDWFNENYFQQCFNTGVVIDPIGPEVGTKRIVKGGVWLFDNYFCRNAYRLTNPPETKSSLIGFRVAAIE